MSTTWWIFVCFMCSALAYFAGWCAKADAVFDDEMDARIARLRAEREGK